MTNPSNGRAWQFDHPAPAAAPVGVVVSGPNHALHAVLTLFTFWACGGWAWIWLLVAANNRKTVQTVDAYGRVIRAPLTPQQIARARAVNKVWLWGMVFIVSLILFMLIVAALSRAVNGSP